MYHTLRTSLPSRQQARVNRTTAPHTPGAIISWLHNSHFQGQHNVAARWCNTGVGEFFYLLPQNIFTIYADVTPMIWKGENHRLFKFKRFIEYIHTENTIINIKSIK
jgi:hypothetical protein